MNRIFRRLTWLLIVVGLLLLAAGVYLRLQGSVSGVEFSPDEFRHRSFHYYAMFGVQVWPRRTQEWESDLEVYLRDQQFVPPATVQPPRWDLVKGFRPGVRVWHGPARMMCAELKCFEGRSADWVEWSKRHPEVAKKLWPRVVELARAERYKDIPNATLAARLAEEDGNFDKYYQEFVEEGVTPPPKAP